MTYRYFKFDDIILATDIEMTKWQYIKVDESVYGDLNQWHHVGSDNYDGWLIEDGWTELSYKEMVIAMI